MRKAFVLGLAAMMVLWKLAGSTAATTTGVISGTAQDLSGGGLANVSLRVRNAQLGRVILETRTGTNGQFLVPGILPDIYIVEALDSSGQVIGVSPTVSMVAGRTATVIVTAVGPQTWQALTQAGLSLQGLGAGASAGIAAAVAAAPVTTVSVTAADVPIPSPSQ